MEIAQMHECSLHLLERLQEQKWFLCITEVVYMEVR